MIYKLTRNKGRFVSCAYLKGYIYQTNSEIDLFNEFQNSFKPYDQNLSWKPRDMHVLLKKIKNTWNRTSNPPELWKSDILGGLIQSFSYATVTIFKNKCMKTSRTIYDDRKTLSPTSQWVTIVNLPQWTISSHMSIVHIHVVVFFYINVAIIRTILSILTSRCRYSQIYLCRHVLSQ